MIKRRIDKASRHKEAETVKIQKKLSIISDEVDKKILGQTDNAKGWFVGAFNKKPA